MVCLLLLTDALGLRSLFYNSAPQPRTLACRRRVFVYYPYIHTLTIETGKGKQEKQTDDSDFVDTFMYRQTRMYGTSNLPNVDYKSP
jgi:hypothetical protein